MNTWFLLHDSNRSSEKHKNVKFRQKNCGLKITKSCRFFFIKKTNSNLYLKLIIFYVLSGPFIFPILLTFFLFSSSRFFVYTLCFYFDLHVSRFLCYPTCTFLYWCPQRSPLYPDCRNTKEAQKSVKKSFLRKREKPLQVDQCFLCPPTVTFLYSETYESICFFSVFPPRF